MQIGFYDFNSLHNESFLKDANNRIKKILEKNAFVEGEFNQSFEERFAKNQGAKHCLLVGNGTDALEISLAALGLNSNSKVAVTNISFYASAEAILNIGAEPVFVDTTDEGLMCAKSLARMVEKFNINAVMPVHIYGLPVDINAIESICNPLNIPIIEDAAQAFGTFLPSGPVGSSNNIATFSFYPTKNLGAIGDAGAILTQSDEIAFKVKNIRNHGRASNLKSLGRNSRCDHIQAAVLDLKLDRANELCVQRKKIASKYSEKLSALNIKLYPQKYIETSSWHLFPILLKDIETRNKVHQHLLDNKISNTLFYEKTLSDEIPLSQFNKEDSVSSDFANKVLCLPMHPFLQDEHIDFIKQKLSETTN